MKKIMIVFTGGTISMKVDSETGGAVPHLTGGDIIEMIPELGSLAEIDFYDFGKYPGPHMTPELMFELALTVQGMIDDENFDGIIITHGTDTLEETAYFLDLYLETHIPVVLTGSMKNSSDPDWDGPQNLIDSIYTCLNKNSRDMGVLVCLNGEINAASEVTKTHTEDEETFASLDFGSLGFVDRGRVIFNRAPRRLETIKTGKINSNVDLLKCYAGMDAKFFRYSADSGVDGLVVEALGVGNVPPAVFEGIEYLLEKGIPVVLVSRCPAGETDDVYSYPGAGKWLREAGVIFAEYLNGQKARIKLILALGKTGDHSELERIFY
ncbi:MAG: asparaginase [Ignavibacteria bacterium]|nr:asparaginase [Ignavibacteria bacterium]